MKTIEVVAAIIQHDGKLFCAQRNSNNKDYLSYKYEFPGGKIELNETREIALLREIKEELDWNINIESFFMTVEHEYPDFKLIMHSYLCSCIEINFTLNEHFSFKWVTIKDLRNLDWAAADIPIVEKLIIN